uniref:Uncharacterized protein n=1 Tax=Oryza meridionalis TaxID=40149 RepID=A0A0E0C104_9ORYZ
MGRQSACVPVLSPLRLQSRRHAASSPGAATSLHIALPPAAADQPPWLAVGRPPCPAAGRPPDKPIQLMTNSVVSEVNEVAMGEVVTDRQGDVQECSSCIDWDSLEIAPIPHNQRRGTAGQ